MLVVDNHPAKAAQLGHRLSISDHLNGLSGRRVSLQHVFLGRIGAHDIDVVDQDRSLARDFSCRDRPGTGRRRGQERNAVRPDWKEQGVGDAGLNRMECAVSCPGIAQDKCLGLVAPKPSPITVGR